MKRRFAQITFLLAAIWLADGDVRAQEPAATAAAEATATPAPTPTLAESIEAKLGAVGVQLTEADANATEEKAVALGLTVADFQARAGRLRELQSLLQRQLTALRRRDEIQKSIEDVRRRVEEFKSKSPEEAVQRHKISQLDALKDQLEAEEAEDSTLALGTETQQRAVEDARARLEGAEQARRAARELLNQNTDAAAKARLEFDAAEAETQRRIAEEALEFARFSLETSRLEQQLGAERTAFLQLQIAEMAPTALFTLDEFEEVKIEIAKRRDKYERELRELQRTHQTKESQRTEAREALEKARGDAEIARKSAMLDMRDAAAQESSRAIELHEFRLADLQKEQRLWEMRQLAHSGADDLELGKFEGEVAAIAEELTRTRTLQEARLSDVRAMALELDKRLGSWEEASGEKATAESKLKSLRKREEITKAYLDGLLSIERLGRRMNEEFKQFRANPTWEDRWVLFKDSLSKFWNREVFTIDDRSFTLIAITLAAVTFVVALLALFSLRWVIVRRLRRSAAATATHIDDIFLMLLEGTGSLFFLAIALWLAIKPLPISIASEVIIRGLLTLLLISQVAVWGNALLARWVEQTMKRRRGEDPASVSALGAISFFGRVIMWLIVALVAFYSFGIEIGPLIAGLGITGIAIAFALQNILSDVLCSVAILLDKPFVVGDFIVVGGASGTVEHIGIKTTRIRSVDGQLTIYPNAGLMGVKIDNFKRMYERRVLFTLNLTYGTPAEKVEIIPKKLREMIESRPLTRFERAHFVRFGASALELEVVYFVLSADYNRFVDTHQAVLLDIYRWFSGQGIEFAVTAPAKPASTTPPTTTI